MKIEFKNIEVLSLKIWSVFYQEIKLKGDGYILLEVRHDHVTCSSQ